MNSDQLGEVDTLKKHIDLLEDDQQLSDPQKIANLKSVVLILLRAQLSQAQQLTDVYREPVRI